MNCPSVEKAKLVAKELRDEISMLLDMHHDEGNLLSNQYRKISLVLMHLEDRPKEDIMEFISVIEAKEKQR